METPSASQELVATRALIHKVERDLGLDTDTATRVADYLVAEIERCGGELNEDDAALMPAHVAE